MIQVRCFTHLDLYNETWPTELPGVPHVNDMIFSRTEHRGFQLRLRVIAVSWHQGKPPNIELHDFTRRSIRDFYNWYAPLIGKPISIFL